MPLRDLVQLLQFKKREKHPWRSVTLKLKVALLHGCFSCFLNCTNGTKSHNAPHIMINILGITECRNLPICEINLLVCSVFIV